jgi:hypothetical protein
MNERIAGELFILAYSVKTGCKPVAMMPIQNRYVDEIKDYVQTVDGIKFYSEPLSEGWTTIYLYKHDYMLEVIKRSPDNPHTPFDHWVLGKMFGYSDEEIGKYIQSKVT